MSEKFDYKGFSKKKLDFLCSKKNIYRGHIKPMFGLYESYSMGLNYRMFSNYPKWLPFYIYSDHGVGNDHVDEGCVHKDTSVIFAFSDRRVALFKKMYNKPCYKVTNPAINYRRKYVKQEEHAKGTIVFPCHGTYDSFFDFDIESYINCLKSLPKKMHPVCVCLYMADVEKGMHMKFIKSGIPVYTAGHIHDTRFIQRFYTILKNFKYSMSNTMGSYAYYSCEMGVPFSLYGDEPENINISNPYYPKGKILVNSFHYVKAKELFSGLHSSITDEQSHHVSECLGLDASLTGEEMRKILYKSIIQKGCAPKFIIKFIIRYMVHLKNSSLNLLREVTLWS